MNKMVIAQENTIKRPQEYGKQRCLQHVVSMNQLILSQLIEPEDVVVDATMGNGNDTVFLCQLVGAKGKVYAFDIQENALIETLEKLSVLKLESIATLIHSGHENIEQLIDEPIKAVVFNLGYLPGADKQLHTQWLTTLQAIEASLKLLQKDGFISITAYPGSELGATETHALENFIQRLPQKQFGVSRYQMINQINEPPILYFIQKRGEVTR